MEVVFGEMAIWRNTPTGGAISGVVQVRPISFLIAIYVLFITETKYLRFMLCGYSYLFSFRSAFVVCFETKIVRRFRILLHLEGGGGGYAERMGLVFGK